jgi:hypothetical protein
LSIPCEVAVRSVIPALRAYISKELAQSYGLKQADIAKLLGITQTAVSKYATHTRGVVLKVENINEVQVIVKELCVSLVNGDMARNEIVKHFCEACRTIRRKRLMCRLCKRSDPAIDIHQCVVCISETSTCRL